MKYSLTFYSYWHCGSGLAAGADMDALVVRDADGLPFVPGKTIKGLVKQAYESLYGKNSDLFGEEGNKQGGAFFSDATIGSERGAIVRDELAPYFYQSISSTAINDNGVADSGSLRKMEVVIPCELTGEILFDASQSDWVDKLTKAVRLIKELGLKRSRGFGRCKFTVVSDGKQETLVQTDEKSSLSFLCTLLTDVILNQQAASEEPNKTLDFIPGNNFLGIAASQYDSYSQDQALVFHSGKVRFSDAHPLLNGKRSLHVPASLYYPKSETPESENIRHHHLMQPEDRSIQRKQCRSGFYDLTTTPSPKALEKTVYAIKSSYDRSKRRAKDEKLFLYQSLKAGQQFVFTVEIDESQNRPELVKKIRGGLIGIRHLGRSKTAQYGLVKIEDWTEQASAFPPQETQDHLVYIYADSRLIFLDSYGLPTFTPDVAQLGVGEGAIRWDLSQIRTFQYAPWNGQRGTHDTDRCGIEKGSVIVVETKPGSQRAATNPQYVGQYQNEGFGRVLVNPSFLVSACRLGEAVDDVRALDDSNPANSALVAYLNQRKLETEKEAKIFKLVNDWVASYRRRFEKISASQWGAIRAIAYSKHDWNELNGLLFDDNVGFLRHGVSASNWSNEKDKENGIPQLFEVLLKFIKDSIGEGEPLDGEDEPLDASDAWRLIVNLASEMAKLSKK